LRLRQDASFMDKLTWVGKAVLWLEISKTKYQTWMYPLGPLKVCWLDASSSKIMLKSIARTDPPLDWKLDDVADQPDAYGILVKEASSLAAHIRPRSLALLKLKTTQQTETRELRVLAMEVSTLMAMISHLAGKVDSR
jgi:hypothetical protein